MVQFSPETKDGHSKALPGKGKLMAPRGSGGKGTTYGPGGPGGSGGSRENAGPNGTTNGPAGQEIKGFTGSGPAVGTKSWPNVRSQSNPMKR